MTQEFPKQNENITSLYPKQNENITSHKTFRQVFIVALFRMTKESKQIKCSSTDKWVAIKCNIIQQ